MSILSLPSDLVIYIAKFLPYNKCILLPVVFRYLKNIPEKQEWLFAHSDLYVLYKANKDLYNICRHSSIYYSNVHKILLGLYNKAITKENLYSYVLLYNCNYVTSSNITNTTQIVKLMFAMIENYEDTDISNYLYVYANDIIINYYISVMERQFKTKCDMYQLCGRYRLAVYTSMWYKSNINMYALFTLYMLNLGVIHVRYTEAILFMTNDGVDYEHKNSNSILDFINFFRLNELILLLFATILSYILIAGVTISTYRQKDIMEYLHACLSSSFHSSDSFE